MTLVITKLKDHGKLGWYGLSIEIDYPRFSLTAPATTQIYIAARKPILTIFNANNLGISVGWYSRKLIKDTFEKFINMSENENSKFIFNNTKSLGPTFNKDCITNNLISQLVSYND